MASALALVPMVTGFPQVSTPAQTHPVQSHLRHVAFTKTSVAAMRAAPGATSSLPRTPGAPDPVRSARAGAVTPIENVAGDVTLVGVTWPKGSVSARATFQVRTFSEAGWGRWRPMDVDAVSADPAEAGRTTGTNPYIVTGASKYQVRSLTTDAQAPTSANVQVVDPGTSSADSLQQAPGAASAAVTQPAIYTRAQWGANEGIRRNAPSYGKVMLGIVHHTDNGNAYAAASVPAMIRAIYSYHVQSLGWSDIGYNFLIDRYGRTWEGRYGGMSRPVVGAQTMNFNSVSSGVSVIGNFAIASPPQAATDAIKRLWAWKFSLAGIPATGTVLANGKYLQRVSGHRDANPTDCPGSYLYAKLPEIRATVASLMASRPPAPPAAASRGVFSPGDFTGDRRSDILGIKANGDLYLYRGNGLGGFTGAGTRIGAGWGIFSKVFAPGDFTGDRRADILGIKANGDMYLYRGNGLGGFTGGGTRIGTGWNVFARVFSPGDFTGDGRADLLGINGSGGLYLYRGNGAGGFTGGGTRIGSGWNVFAKVFSSGDFTGDGRTDVLGINGTGGLYLYRGTGAGGFTGGGTRIGSGWNVFARVFGQGDFSGDGRTDILGVNGAGAFYLYRGSGAGGFSGAGTWVSSGWSVFL